MDSILGLVFKRIGLGILTLLAISIIFFIGVEALPGDFAEEILGMNALPETVAAFRKELKLDLPPHERYIAWLGDLMQGDLGKSLANGRPVVDLVGWRFANTLFLALSAAVIAVPVAILLGIIAALYRNSLFDRAISIATLSTISFPEFFVAYILIALLSVQMIIFPSISNINDQMSFWQKIHTIVLPCLTLTLVVVAHMMRQTRAAIYTGKETVLEDINLKVRRGRTVALVGESGSGKSTLAFYFGLRGKACEDKILELLDMIELPDHYIERLPTELSGGEKQRICIARALAANPEVIICDEVTSALDQLVAEGILELLQNLQNKLQVSYLFITHDLATVKAIADEIVVMLQGRIVEQGVKKEILAPPHHEYTELLLSSVPEMDPDWLDNLLKERRENA